jgi:hypothetical protein
VDRAAGDPHAVIERLLLRVHAGERGQERRVDVDHPVRIRVEEHRREHAHEAGEHDPVDPGFDERFDERGVEALAIGEVAVRDRLREDARVTRPGEAGDARLVRDDEAEAGAEPAVADRVEDRSEVRAPSGDEDAEVHARGVPEGMRRGG